MVVEGLRATKPFWYNCKTFQTSSWLLIFEISLCEVNWSCHPPLPENGYLRNIERSWIDSHFGQPLYLLPGNLPGAVLGRLRNLVTVPWLGIVKDSRVLLGSAGYNYRNVARLENVSE